MKRVRPIRGFTLLEVLTAMAIVALMIGLLIPAIGTIRNTASTVKQKAQFHAIEIALETFQTDTGDYPPSNYTNLYGSLAPGSTDGYCGSMKLAEAIVGLDGFGFHPKSQWRSDRLINDGTGNIPIYFGRTTDPRLESATYTDADRDANMKLRKGPYLDLERANAVQLNSLYPTKPTPHIIFGDLRDDAFVLCDMFGTVKNLGTGKKTGMPILYFKADTNNRLSAPSTVGTFAGDTSLDGIYNVNENYPFLLYAPPWGNVTHPMTQPGRPVFYKRIKNPNYPGTAANNFKDARPYRAQSFILLSAGADGLYGTSDDVYNIDENDK